MQDPGTGRISIVGDVMIRGRLAEAYRQPTSEFQRVVAHFNQSAAVVANLEMPLSRRGYRMPKWSNLRSDPDVIMDISAMGIDAVTLANNHMLDFGPDALFDTLAACDKAGILRCGAGADIEAALQPVMLEVNGERVAVLGVASTLPVGSDATSERPGIAPVRVTQSFELDLNLHAEQPGMMPLVRTQTVLEDQERLCDTVRQLKQSGAYVVVNAHWGVPEHWLSPSQGVLAEYQQPLAHALVDAGADLICGHHSHTLHPVELYRGKPIFYSLGNFLFERPRDFMEPASFIIELWPGAEPSIELTPVLLDTNGFPRLVTDTEADHVLRRLNELSQPFATTIQIQDGRGRVVG